MLTPVPLACFAPSLGGKGREGHLSISWNLATKYRHHSFKCWYWSEAPVEKDRGKNWLIWKVPDAGKDWKRRGQQRMRWLDGIINLMDMSLSKLGVGDGQGGLECCSPWVRESDTTEWLNWTELKTGEEHGFPGTSCSGDPQRGLWATSQQSRTWPGLSGCATLWRSGSLKARPRRPDAWGLMKGHRVGQVSLVTGLRGFLKDAMWTLFSFSLTVGFFL